MKCSVLVTLGVLVSTAVSSPIPVAEPPDVEAAAKQARFLVHVNNLATLSTVYQSGPRKGLPVGQIEYYADCPDEQDALTFIGVDASTVFHNVKEGSPASLAIRVGDRSLWGHSPASPAAHPRLSLFGEFIEHTGDKKALEQCFVRSHRDAKKWIPGGQNDVHDSHWLKFNITGIHFIGGFGDKAYIGDIPVELYRNVTVRVKEELKHSKASNKGCHDKHGDHVKEDKKKEYTKHDDHKNKSKHDDHHHHHHDTIHHAIHDNWHQWTQWFKNVISSLLGAGRDAEAPHQQHPLKLDH
jgi:hypothetical protein